ncbi:phospho-N-acetylmuramoyl-pentapeptide-transferase [Desulfonatronospira thiodismutans ASO3-1]|uniref:Phospho-N-acetylmuramoyl-pentapeptide-transferase n=1 Tax=Desulfonatronospira thiodismutans ASO3-1 TaxID=555779 RepID=D6SUH8_9BACT|nr:MULTISPECIES: phospho-N-acetylmuramoyl-pentapeptide-transferase [Desulfonatronospira]EFI32958.1 phospho-N-acetylmuramoyl-pentapeptide-transferase [Desulfonatronospira thiodismutans ASO3-1]RQD76472.1 MAG: phospho-N-acetylmuramoyl-pentapeptide-transferase [Desulfonatronospira sp. MSAO_Bac3]
MLYHLLYPLSEDISFFNVFRYITFRSIYALLTALLLSLWLGPKFIKWLQRIKCGQYVQEDGPDHQVKQGTPTMGGVLVAFSLAVSVLLWGDLTNKLVWMCLFVFGGFFLVGFFDDYLKVIKKHNQGLSVKSKLLGQGIIALGAVSMLLTMPGYNTELLIPFFKDLRPDLFLFYVPFAAVVMIGASNGVNLTDGLDGLAIGPYIVSAGCLSIFVYVSGHYHLADYLQVPYIPGLGEVTVFCGALVGAGLGFLWYNAYPAQIFMGDTGSISLGGTLGFIAVLCKQELLLIIVGGLFVIETLSVILQVGYYKMSGGKRIFRMAPLHHHFELKGVPESKIIIRFWILSILFALAALSTLKLR